MAQFRSTADIMDLALQNGGEVTNGNSPYEAQVLNYLNRVHFAIVAGGTIPLGKDTTVEIDEVWPWARSSRPLLLELQPKYDTGTVSLVLGSEVGAFSSAPSASLAGWYLRVKGRDEVFRIASHTAAATAFELDSAYTDDTGALNFEAFKLDYELVPDYIVIDSTNNKVQFQKVAGTTITGTLTAGTYSPAALATHVASVITAAASGPVITGAYSSITRKFSLTSDLAGPTVFILVGNGSEAAYSGLRTLGYDDSDSTSAATQTSLYPLGGISRLIEPMKIHRGMGDGGIYGIDAETYQRHYPLLYTPEDQPDRFAVLREDSDGIITVRFNAFPREKTRVEVEHVAVPHDLKDNAASIPRIPRKHVDVLEDAATFYLMLVKSDDKMQIYSNLLQGKLKAMIAQHRGSLVRAGDGFGQITPRKDLIGSFRSRRALFPSEPY